MTMPKYRKKPVVIEAEQFHITKRPWPDGVVELMLAGRDWKQLRPGIITLEGAMGVSDGDWIITGVKGERYACKPDIFELTYELVAKDDTHLAGSSGA